MEKITIPKNFDANLGARLREGRVLKGLSLEALGNVIGLSYQQLQKYESGANRISTSRLWQIIQVTKLPISWFLENVDQPLGKRRSEQIFTLLEVMRIWEQIPVPMRPHLLATLKNAAE